MSKFKVGDRVVYTEHDAIYSCFGFEDIGEVFEIDIDGDLWITSEKIKNSEYPHGICIRPSKRDIVHEHIYNSPLYKALS